MLNEPSDITHTRDDVFFWYSLRHAVVYKIYVRHVLCMYTGSTSWSDITYFLLSILGKTSVFFYIHIVLLEVCTQLVI